MRNFLRTLLILVLIAEQPAMAVPAVMQHVIPPADSTARMMGDAPDAGHSGMSAAGHGMHSGMDAGAPPDAQGDDPCGKPDVCKSCAHCYLALPGRSVSFHAFVPSPRPEPVSAFLAHPYLAPPAEPPRG